MDNLRAPCVNTTTAATNATAFGPGGPCTWPAATRWNPAIRDLRDAIFRNAAPSFMGGIHPRFKREVGRRLARALTGDSSPTLLGCELLGSPPEIASEIASRDVAPRTQLRTLERIRLKFDVAAQERLHLSWSAADYNMTGWGVQGALKDYNLLPNQLPAIAFNPQRGWDRFGMRWQGARTRGDGIGSLRTSELLSLSHPLCPAPPHAYRFVISDGLRPSAW